MSKNKEDHNILQKFKERESYSLGEWLVYWFEIAFLDLY